MCNPEAPLKGCFPLLLACNSFLTSLIWKMHSVNSHHLKGEAVTNEYFNKVMHILNISILEKLNRLIDLRYTQGGKNKNK